MHSFLFKKKLKFLIFFKKVPQVAILKVEHCNLLHLEANLYLSNELPNRYLYFLTSDSFEKKLEKTHNFALFKKSLREEYNN